MLPSFLFTFVYLIFPLFFTLYLSFTEYNFFYSKAPEFIGFQNYFKLFSDPDFLAAFKNSLYFMIIFVPLFIVISLSIALFLNVGVPGWKVFRICVFIPVAVPLSIASVAFIWVLDSEHGILNQLLRMIGMNCFTRDWLLEESVALNTIIGVTLWKYMGIGVIMLLAGLQVIPKQIFEGAKLDGANFWQQTIYIAIPNLKESFVIVGIYGIMVALKVFTQVYIMTAGGPGRLTLVLYLNMYKNVFEYYRLGYGAAIAYVLAVLIFGFAIMVEKFIKTEKK